MNVSELSLNMFNMFVAFIVIVCKSYAQLNRTVFSSRSIVVVSMFSEQ